MEQTNTLIYEKIIPISKYERYYIKAELSTVGDKHYRNPYADFTVNSYHQKYRKDIKDWDNDRLSDIETIKLAPEIEKLLPLCGADQFGCPLYPIDNAQYYLENKENDNCFKAFLTNYRIEETDDLINQLLEAPNKSVFRFLVDKSGIRNRWREEAENGIKILEL